MRPTYLTAFALLSSLVAAQAHAAVSGELKQWHEVLVTIDGPSSSQTANPNPFLDYRFNVTFTGPSGKTYVVPGYFAGDGVGGAAGNVWAAHFNPHETGSWTWSTTFRSGANVAVDLATNAGTVVSASNGLSGTFTVAASDKTGADFRAADKGMLVNRGNHYLTYGGSGKPFLWTGPGIPENILGYRGFTNTTVGTGHNFDAHLADWNTGDPDWNSGAGKKLIGALNYIAENGANCIYMMSQTIGGDGKDCFPHPTTDTTKTRYDLLKLRQWDIALAHAQRKGIFLHWALAENETANYTYYGGTATSGSLTTERKLYFRMLMARFGHYNGLKWNLCEEIEWIKAERVAQMAYLKAIDPYDHPITHQAGGAGLGYSIYDEQLGNSNFDAMSFQGSASRTEMFDKIKEYRDKSATAGVKWTSAWDEPQKIENNTSETLGYPMGRRDKMWPCLMGGGDGFLWYIQADGSGHGFDQRIEDFTIMRDSFRWSGFARDFLSPLPLTAMTPSRSIVASTTGEDYALYQAGEVYAIFNDRAGSGMTLNLGGVSNATSFTVRWFNPRNGGALATGTVATVTGGGSRSLGNAPSDLTKDWAVLVKRSGGTPVNVAPTVNAGPDRTVILPATASLDGTVTDDGLPSGTVTQTWSKVSGPGTVTFASTTAVDTTASFSTAGSYVLRLTASDGALSANDTVTVTVASPTANLPPAVAISTPVTGATFTAPANIAAAAIATDSDGTVSKVEFLVDGVLRHTENFAPYDFAWNAVPVGTYQLTARATDNMGAITTSVAVTVTVSSTVTNSAPIVDAGPNRTITLPATASLDGTVTDDGKPTPINLTQTWTKVSGPGTVTFANAAAVDTTASFSVAGSYVLRLTASDGELSANDTVSVTVSDASGGNAIITLTDDCYLENGTLKNDTYLKVESGTRTRVAYVRFSVSGLGGIAPASASLTLKVNGDAGSGTVRVNQGSHSNWSETTLTSANAPTVGTQLAAITGGFALSNTVVINLASIITVDGNYTIILRLDAGGNDVWFGSDEGTAKPVLSINVAPSGSG